MVFSLIHDGLSEKNTIRDSLRNKGSSAIRGPFRDDRDIRNFFGRVVKKGKHDTIGLFYHNNPSTHQIPFVPKENMYNISGLFLSFVKHAKSVGIKKIDLVTCEFRDPAVHQEIHRVSVNYGITIRYSIDETSTPNNWILESHNTDVEKIYFKTHIDPSISLGMDWGGNMILGSDNRLYSPILNATHTLYYKSAGHDVCSNANIEKFEYTDYGYGFKTTDDKLYVTSHDGRNVGSGDSNPAFMKNVISDVSDFNIGLGKVIVLQNDGTVKCAGDNRNGSCGTGSSSSYVTTFETCIDSGDNNMSNVKTVCAGLYNTFILKNDGTVWGSGFYNFKTLTGYSSDQSKFVQIKLNDGNNLTGIQYLKLSQQGMGVFAVDGDGNGYIWGSDRYRTPGTDGVDCGVIVIPHNSDPIVYASLNNGYHGYFEGSFSGGSPYSCLIRESGKVYKFGGWHTGTLDAPAVTEITELRPDADNLGVGKKVVEIEDNDRGLYFRIDDGTVYFVGQAPRGEAGGSFYNSQQSTPIQLASLTNVNAIGGGATGNTGFLVNNTIKVWGLFRNFWTGTDHREYHANPSFSGKSIVQWSYNSQGLWVLATDKNVYGWHPGEGYGYAGAFTEHQVTSTGDVIQLASGYEANVAYLRSNGEVYHMDSGYKAFAKWGGSIADTGFKQIGYTLDNLLALGNNGYVYSSGTNSGKVWPENSIIDGSALSPGSSAGTGAQIFGPDSVDLNNYLTSDDSGKTIASISPIWRGVYLILEDGGAYYSGTNRGHTGTTYTNSVPSISPYPVLNNDNTPMKDIQTITSLGQELTIFTTTTGKTYYAGVTSGTALEATLGGNKFPRTAAVTTLNNAVNILGPGVSTPAIMVMYEDGFVKVAGSTQYLGISGDYRTVGLTDLSDYYTPITTGGVSVKSMNAHNIFGGVNPTEAVTQLTNLYSGDSIKPVIKRLLRTDKTTFATKYARLSSANLLGLFNTSFATELASTSRNVLLKMTDAGTKKYVIGATERSLLQSGDVLYIPEDALTGGKNVTLVVDDVDYTYTLFATKITYDSTDYAIGDTIAFGDLSLTIKGLDSTEFVEDGVSVPGAPKPCFLPGTLIRTEKGMRPIEKIKNGDMIYTQNGLAPAKVYKYTINKTDKDTAPYVIKANAFGKQIPFCKTLISETHAIAFGDNIYSFPNILARYTKDVYQAKPGKKVVYYNIETPNYLTSLMNANGMPVETFAANQIPKEVFCNYKLIKVGEPYYRRCLVDRKTFKDVKFA